MTDEATHAMVPLVGVEVLRPVGVPRAGRGGVGGVVYEHSTLGGRGGHKTELEHTKNKISNQVGGGTNKLTSMGPLGPGAFMADTALLIPADWRSRLLVRSVVIWGVVSLPETNIVLQFCRPAEPAPHSSSACSHTPAPPS